MSVLPDFKIRTQAASGEDLALALVVYDYCRRQLDLKPSHLFALVPGLERTELNSTVSQRTKKHYGKLVQGLYGFLTVQQSDGRYARLDKIHEWMVDPICLVLPELNAHFRRGPAGYHQRLNAVAAKGDNTRSKIVSSFGGERYIYRYARNAENGEVRIAKGRLTVPTEVDDAPFHSFAVEYQATPRRDGGLIRESRIDGSILFIKSHFMFIGVEDGRDDAFVMVIRDEGHSDIHGALILRKHLDRGFMATRGLVMTLGEGGEDAIGAFLAEKLPELPKSLEELLLNIGNHEGQGPLTLPDV